MSQPVEIKIVNPLLGTTFPLPSYATEGSAGVDLRACIEQPVILNPGETLLIPSGFALQIHDPSLMAVISSRSGLGIKKGIVVAQGIGIIDSDYEGEIGIGLWNRGKEPYTIQPGERICQMVFVPVVRVEFSLVREFTHASQRGSGGFGSTGSH